MLQQVSQLNNAGYINSEEVQAVINAHFNIPRDIRIETANILCTELTTKTGFEIKDYPEFQARYGIFATFLMTIQVIPAWKQFKSTFKKIPEFLPMCIAEMLDVIFSLMKESTTATSTEMNRLSLKLSTFISSYTRLIQAIMKDTSIDQAIKSKNKQKKTRNHSSYRGLNYGKASILLRSTQRQLITQNS